MVRIVTVCGAGVFLSMGLVNWAATPKGTAAAFGIYVCPNSCPDIWTRTDSEQAVAYSFGPTTIIDSIRTSIWHQSVFGSAYALKITMNNAMNIIVRIVTGVLQDQSPAFNPYKKVTPVYVVLSVLSLVISLILVSLFLLSKTSKRFRSLEVDIGRLQWTRKQRLRNGEDINERRGEVDIGIKMRKISQGCFGGLVVLVLGSWVAYFWGVATGNND